MYMHLYLNERGKELNNLNWLNLSLWDDFLTPGDLQRLQFAIELQMQETQTIKRYHIIE